MGHAPTEQRGVDGGRDGVQRSLSGLRDDGAGGRPSVFQQARRRITRGASISALWLGSWRAASISVWMFEMQGGQR